MSGDWLALGSVAALAVAGTAARGSRARFAQTRFAPASSELLEAIEENLATMEQIWPASARRLLDVTGQVKAGRAPGGWFFPDLRIIRLTAFPRSAGLVTHQALHALDYRNREYQSHTQGHPARLLATKARELARPALEAQVQLAMEKRLERLPVRLRERLKQGRMPLQQALQILVEDLGWAVPPATLQAALDHARSPFGGVARNLLVRRLSQLDDDQLDLLIQVGSLQPGGMPFSMFSRPEAQRIAYHTSIALDEARKRYQSYLFRLNEVYARLMDQVLREEALRRGLPIVHMERTRPEDVPLHLLGELEEDVWRLVHLDLGWHR